MMETQPGPVGVGRLLNIVFQLGHYLFFAVGELGLLLYVVRTIKGCSRLFKSCQGQARILHGVVSELDSFSVE